jgi:predicted nucleic acid-binding protein
VGCDARVRAHHHQPQDRSATARRRGCLQRLGQWLELPHVHVAHSSAAHFARLRLELERLGAAGDLTTALTSPCSRWSGYVLYSTDADFARFPGLGWVNPCK